MKKVYFVVFNDISDVVWEGPYNTREAALEFAREYEGPMEHCEVLEFNSIAGGATDGSVQEYSHDVQG